MPDILPTNLLEPCLLEKLTDDEPGKSRESRTQRVITMQTYRKSVLRDLAWLLNTRVSATENPLDDYPEVRQSVLNFGIREFTGRTAGELLGPEFERRVTAAIATFEPRILRHTLRVTIRADARRYANNALSFEIEGQLWAEPVSERLWVRTQVDLETGQMDLAG